jgi:hypothetical protein
MCYMVFYSSGPNKIHGHILRVQYTLEFTVLPHPQQSIGPLPHVDMEGTLHPSVQC